MKKRLIGVMLALLLLVSSLVVPTPAHAQQYACAYWESQESYWYIQKNYWEFYHWLNMDEYSYEMYLEALRQLGIAGNNIDIYCN